jgi:hypothetical protein
MVAPHERKERIVLLFGHDPVMVEERCTVLRTAGLIPMIVPTSGEAEALLARAAILFIGSYCAPLTRERLTAAARRHGVPVLSIPYSRTMKTPEGAVHVEKTVTATELAHAVALAIAA